MTVGEEEGKNPTNERRITQFATPTLPFPSEWVSNKNG